MIFIVLSSLETVHDTVHMAFSESIHGFFFCTETNEAQEVCCGREMEGTFMRMCGFFPTSSVSHVQPACE